MMQDYFLIVKMQDLPYIERSEIEKNAIIISWWMHMDILWAVFGGLDIGLFLKMLEENAPI